MPEQHECDWELILGRSKADCKTEGCPKKLSLSQIEARLNATGRFLNALRDKLLISPGNETICTWCGSIWAIGSPHEWHDEDCPLYADIL